MATVIHDTNLKGPEVVKNLLCVKIHTREIKLYYSIWCIMIMDFISKSG